MPAVCPPRRNREGAGLPVVAASCGRDGTATTTLAAGIVRDLLTSPRVVCDSLEVDQALGRAGAHPAWIEDPALLVIEDPNA